MLLILPVDLQSIHEYPDLVSFFQSTENLDRHAKALSTKYWVKAQTIDKRLEEYGSEEIELSPLAIAAEIGNLAHLDALLKYEVDADFELVRHFATNNYFNNPNQRNYSDRAVVTLYTNALVRAAYKGHQSIVSRLLEFQCFIDMLPFGGNATVQAAIKNGHIDIAKQLLQYPEVQNQVATDKNAVLHAAIEFGHLELVTYLLEFPPVRDRLMVWSEHDYAKTALLLAVQNGHLPIVDRLLAFPKVQEEVITPQWLMNHNVLCESAKYGHLDVLNRLLDIPGVADAIAENENSVLLQAARYGHISVANRLLEFKMVRDQIAVSNGRINLDHNSYEKHTALDLAAMNGHVIMVDLLLTFQEVVDEVAANNNGALRAAAGSGSLEIVNRLLAFQAVKEGVGVWVKSNDGQSALQAAAKNGHRHIIERLLTDFLPTQQEQIAAGFNAAVRWAAKNGHDDIVDRLLEFPEVQDKISLSDDSVMSALRYAVSNGHLRVVNRLLTFPTVRANLNILILLDGIESGDIKIVNVLLEFEGIRTQINAENNLALQLAARLGYFDIVQRLLEFPDVHTQVDANDNESLRCAAAGGYLLIVKRLLEFPVVQEKINLWVAQPATPPRSHALSSSYDSDDSDDALSSSDDDQDQYPPLKSSALQAAAQNGHLDVVNYLLSFPAAEECVAAQNNWALFLAVMSGHLDVVNRLLEYSAVLEKLTNINNVVLCAALVKGHLDIVNRLLGFKVVVDELANSASDILKAAVNSREMYIFNRLLELPVIQAQVVAKDSKVLSNAIFTSHEWIIKRVLEFPIQDQINELSYNALERLAHDGHLAVLDYLLMFPAVRKLLACGNDILYSAVHSGSHALVEWLLAYPEVQNSIADKKHRVLSYAAEKGSLIVVNRLLDFVAVQNIVAVDHNEALLRAVENGHLVIVNRLLEFEAVQKYLTVNDNAIFRAAVRKRYDHIIHQLLYSPEVFAYAEIHQQEYDERYVLPFVKERLAELRSRIDQLETSEPNAIFNINDREAKQYFYILRNLIRRYSPEWHDDVVLLMNIPAVRAILHQYSNEYGYHSDDNELLRLALRLNHPIVAGLLITVPAVRLLAEQSSFYRWEARGQFDLRAMAEDPESSIRALSTGEQKLLDEAWQRYKPIIQANGVETLFSALKEQLNARYQVNPAHITLSNGGQKRLPVNWEDFNALRLSPKEKQLALNAYYQHKDHTALRYLTKPNRWMANDADYVERDPHYAHLGWSTFESYKPLIVMLWLGAGDVNTPPIDGFTLETRMTHFIDELGLLGRAHNWDSSRVKRDSMGNPILDEYNEPIMEEFDDRKGDKPSCYSGVKRRLFQSVLGHPLLKILTLDDIKQELRDIVRQHFITYLTLNNRDALQTTWKLLCEEGVFDSTLNALDVPKRTQEEFIGYLTDK
ncbi:MAG: ankyrin repeat domain-containing protein, partial [Legionellaceae bacterium]|nr:ankyrin repeat domain-containing protein [Legionellaceae bacterium]